MKKKALIIFKAKWDWNKFVIKKISNFYEVKYIYLDQIKKNYLDTISEINNLIEINKIEIAFFDVDYQKFINFYFIENIKNVKKVMMTFDNYERHNLNIITASSCHVVLSDIISIFKYRELGIQAYNWFLESDGSFYKNLHLEKKIDVLFFGKVNKERKEFLIFLENNGIKIKIVGNNSDTHVSDEKLVELINKSKIVINFTKTTWGKIDNFPERQIFKNQYQLKGRIIQAGLCGTACVSEYAPHNELLYEKDELLQFNSKNDCLSILNLLLKDNDKLTSYTEKFSSKTVNFYEDKKMFKDIFNYIESITSDDLDIEKYNLNIIPYWYKRICAKQVLLRDLKIPKIFSSFYNLKEVIKITEKSNIATTTLIFVESAVNLIYYCLLNTFKPKSTGKNRYTDEL